MESHNCRICGLYINDAPWGIDNQTPTYEICPCCGVEFGYEDYTLESVETYRRNWINGGAKWLSTKVKPDNWDLENQLQHIPIEFR